MPQRRVFYLDANRLSAYHWHSGKLTPEDNFTADSRGVEAFAAYLALHQQDLFYVLADVVEEGFQPDVIPHVQGGDRTALLKRKNDQYFHGAPLNLAIPLGRETTGRRDDKMLFLALTKTQMFEPWMEALRDAECQLVGVYSLPLIGHGFATAHVKNTRDHPERFLLVTLTRAGLRQTFFDKGQLRFSRLTPLANDSLDEVITACSVESARIYQYLIGYRLFDRGAPLTTLVLTHPAQTTNFQERCRDTNDIHFEFLDLIAESTRSGLKTVPADSHSETFFLHLMVRQTPGQQFAEAGERRFYRLWQTRLGLNSASVVILASCLIFSGKQLVQFYQTRDETEQIQQQAEMVRLQYNAALKTLPTMPFTSNNLRALIDRYDILVKRTPSLEPTYRRISEALEQAQRVELDRIDWKLGSNPEEAQQVPDGSGKPVAAVKTAQSTDLFVIADVFAQLPVALKNDERTLKGIIDTFHASLVKDGKVQVKVLKLPFDVESTKTLKSSDETAAVVEVPRFSVRVIQKL
ncbi:MAG: hypothetical protein D4S02_03635 [Rhodocyclaceae bacterium]|nr:MAG: hypothetical protein D4S02_03635 [Rhodocyclaceae bacterium]